MPSTEPTLTGAEKARLAYLLARGGTRVVRKGSAGKWDREIDELWAGAREREQAERRLAEAERQRAADEKAKRRAESRWF